LDRKDQNISKAVFHANIIALKATKFFEEFLALPLIWVKKGTAL
jgi:hypothetical protein